MDSKKYVNENKFIKVDTVKEWKGESQVVILGEGEEHTFKDGVPKLQLPVTHTATKTAYTWTMGYKAIEDLARELETYDTTKWVGAVVKLLVVNLGQGKETVTGTVIQKPN